MSDPFRASRNERPPGYDREQGDAVWIVAAFGIALLLGFGVWEMAHRSHPARTTPYAMTFRPTSGAGVSVHRPDETSGQAARPSHGRITDPSPPR
jgi:hypothetical protein